MQIRNKFNPNKYSSDKINFVRGFKTSHPSFYIFQSKFPTVYFVRLPVC